MKKRKKSTHLRFEIHDIWKNAITFGEKMQLHLKKQLEIIQFRLKKTQLRLEKKTQLRLKKHLKKHNYIKPNQKKWRWDQWETWYITGWTMGHLDRPPFPPLTVSLNVIVSSNIIAHFPIFLIFISNTISLFF